VEKNDEKTYSDPQVEVTTDQGKIQKWPTFSSFFQCTMIYWNFGNTNKCTIYIFFLLLSSYMFWLVAIFRELTTKFH